MRRIHIIFMCIVVVVAGLIYIEKKEGQAYRIKDIFTDKYDQMNYDLETLLQRNVFLDNILFYNNMQFIEFDPETYRHSLGILIRKLKDYNHQISMLNEMIEDQHISAYSHEIVNSIGVITEAIEVYSTKKQVQSCSPNITTLYQNTYELMRELSAALELLDRSQDNLNEYIDAYRDYDIKPSFYATLNNIRKKNRIRIVYTYLYMACYIASHDDYSGLHTDPKMPYFLDLNDGVHAVYELNTDVLRQAYTFTQTYIDIQDIIKNSEHSISIYAKLLNKVLMGVDSYIAIREQFPKDYFSSYDFLQDQKVADINRRIPYFVFDHENAVYTSLKKAYFQVKMISDRSPLNILMFKEGELPDNVDVDFIRQ